MPEIDTTQKLPIQDRKSQNLEKIKKISKNHQSGKKSAG